MNFLSNQTDQLGVCFLIHNDRDNNTAFIIDKYVVGEHVDDETVIMVDNMEDAHNKCIDMIIKKHTVFERTNNDGASEPSIYHLIVIVNQVAITSRRGVGNVIICNKTDINSFIELKLTGFKYYKFIIDERIPAGHLLSVYGGGPQYDAIGSVVNSVEGDQYWLKLQDNYLDYCCMSKFDFSNQVLPNDI